MAHCHQNDGHADHPHNADNGAAHKADHKPDCCGGGCHGAQDDGAKDDGTKTEAHHPPHGDPGDETPAALPDRFDHGACATEACAAACGDGHGGDGETAGGAGAKPTGWKPGWGDDPGDETPHAGADETPACAAGPDHAEKPHAPGDHHHAPKAADAGSGAGFRPVAVCRHHQTEAGPGPAPNLPILAVLYDVPDFSEPPPQLQVQPLSPLPCGPEGEVAASSEGMDPGWLERWQEAVKFNNAIRETNDAAAAAYRSALTEYHIKRDECYRETQWARDQNRHLAALNRDRIAAYNAALSVWLAAGGCLENSAGWLTLPPAEAKPADDVVCLADTPQVA